MNHKCNKCGKEEVSLEYISKTQKYCDESKYDTVDNKSNFVERANWQTQGHSKYSVEKEHLYCTCKVCGYKWLEDTLDNIKKS